MFAALISLHSMPFSLGPVNFEFGTGISLWAIASWIALSRTGKWWCRIFVHIVFSSILFLAHFFALGIYGLVIGIFELHRILDLRFNAQRAATIVFILACPVTLMLLLMLWTGASVGEGDNEWSFSWKPI